MYVFPSDPVSVAENVFSQGTISVFEAICMILLRSLKKKLATVNIMLK